MMTKSEPTLNSFITFSGSVSTMPSSSDTQLFEWVGDPSKAVLTVVVVVVFLILPKETSMVKVLFEWEYWFAHTAFRIALKYMLALSLIFLSEFLVNLKAVRNRLMNEERASREGSKFSGGGKTPSWSI